ncbi:family 16 glycosylhydrolase [Jannaschia rubra]|uniref:Beta-glucanase n=1 Tax=Jannaschia rubra TaxID=282197 RepID=A0A0M6XQ37_9RHOB|nr:family 16 glycosylhydrolase [Jannaschia rubra]CTQ32697.1 Beta-glucanase precursor [Jannaschia rubra]SFF87702.1 Glycosyl hydrolases family 16 [Jannaschia rubra]
MFSNVPVGVQRAVAGVALATGVALAAQAEPEGAFLSRFDTQDRLGEGWQVSHFTIRTDDFRTAWTRDAIAWTAEGLTLSLLPAPEEAETPFHGAEVQRVRRTHYGRYEVEMTAARGMGVISSLFTYTGPYYGDPQDEIDFEFLGRDTTKVWVTRFAKGERLPGQWLDLGFDAADGPHLYAFDWLPDRIVWYVDGEEFFRVEGEDYTLPDIPGRIMFNVWAGGPAQADWSGVAPEDMEAQAEYRCISYRPPESSAPMCSDPVPGG